MADDEMKKYYFAVIGIVAIVAVVGLVYGLSGSKAYKIAPSQASDSDLVGEAVEVSKGKIISSCQDIQTSGTYTLNNDITVEDTLNPFKPCLRVHDVNNIYINCNRHKIGGGLPLEIKNVKYFSVSLCTLNKDVLSPVVNILNSKNGIFSKNRINGGYFNVEKSSNIQITDNIFINSYYQQFTSNNNKIKKNIFNPNSPPDSNPGPPGIIVSNFGRNNLITNNQIDGKSDGITRVGADDGIVIQDESGTIIKDNNIKNNWDCGIETLGVISRVKIIGNYIKNSGVCGIGGWYWNSWISNKVRGNIIDDAPRLFLFYRVYGFRPKDIYKEEYGFILKQEDYVYFKNNIFDNNKIINPRDNEDTSHFNMEGFHEASNGGRDVTENDYILANNRFANNDFTNNNAAPFFNPKSMIVDGGGNICSAKEPDYPLKCLETSSTK